MGRSVGQKVRKNEYFLFIDWSLWFDDLLKEFFSRYEFHFRS